MVKVQVDEGKSVARPVLQKAITRPETVAPILIEKPRVQEVLISETFTPVRETIKLIQHEQPVIKLAVQPTPVQQLVKQEQPVANIFKKIGGAIKKGVQGLGNFVEKLAVTAISGAVGGSLTPKASAPSGGTLTPKPNAALPQTLNPIQQSGQSFLTSEKEGGLGSVLGLQEEKSVPWYVWVLGGLLLILLLPKLLKR